MRARFAGVSLLLVSTACGGYIRAGDPPPKSGGGPDGYIQATYSGGLVYRNLTASFRLDESGYVLVGHLGGDGYIRVLFPETPRQSTWVSRGKTIQTRPVDAHYDGAPSLYRFIATPHRGLAATMDSYDGLGHGFIFMITSKRPIAVSRISDDWDFFEMPADGYYASWDPREFVREFASLVVTGPASLRFATNRNTLALTSWAGTAWDCAVLSSLGMLYPYGFGMGWAGAMPWALRTSWTSFDHGGYCGWPSYADRYAYSYYPDFRSPNPRAPSDTLPPTGDTTITNRPITPDLIRPGRTFADEKRADGYRDPLLDRPMNGARRPTDAPRFPLDRGRWDGDSDLRGPGRIGRAPQRPDDDGIRTSRPRDVDSPVVRPEPRPVARDVPRSPEPRSPEPRQAQPRPEPAERGEPESNKARPEPVKPPDSI